jgi:hypothetical protein
VRIVYFPIGKVCTAAYAANEAKVRVKNYPFDWSGNSYKTVSYILDNGLDDIFDDVEIVNSGLFENKQIWDKTYKMMFIHEKEDKLSTTKKKYLKRYNNIIHDIKNGDVIYLIQSSSCERILSDHYSDLVPFFKSNILIEEDMDSNNLDCVKESILKINPNIDIKTTSYSIYKTLVEELGYLK